MSKKDILSLIREIHVQMGKIIDADLDSIEKDGRCFAGNKDWSLYADYCVHSSSERAELNRTILSLQKNLVKLRKAMY